MSLNFTSKLSEYDRRLIIGYLYDQLDEAELATFEAKLNNDPEFAAVFKQQQELESLIPKGENIELSDETRATQRWQLSKALRKYKQPRLSLTFLIQSINETKVSLKAQFASTLVAFVLGFLLTTSLPKPPQSTISGELAKTMEHSSSSNSMSVNRLLFSDYEVLDFNLDSYDQTSGAVQVSYALGAKNKIKGQLDDPLISQLFAKAMKAQTINDSTRLNVVELFDNKSTSTSAQQTLQYSLLNDPNPGVRIAAAQALTKLASNKTIRDTLREALKSDLNQGIRVTAFQALINHLEDKETIELLKTHSVTDSNNFIRETSQKLTQPNPSI